MRIKPIKSQLFRLLFLTIFAFSTSICFAGEKEEEEELAELNTDIAQPIMNNFRDDDSLTRLMSREMITLQEHEGKIKSSAEAKRMRHQAELIVQSKLDPKRYSEMHNAARIIAENNNEHNMDPIDENATYLSVAWGYKAADCEFYARMVLTAFMFNRMNTASKLRNAVLVVAETDTGDHWLVLVEGNSGATFAVDLWIRKVVKLKRVPKLSEITDVKFPQPQKITDLFAHTHKGKVYYDEIFVKENTVWILARNLSTTIQIASEKYNAPKNPQEINRNLTMKDIYMYLRPYFPRWKKDYDKLFPDPGELKESGR